MEITQQLLYELFDYREDGNLVRKYPAAGVKNGIGSVVGCKPKKISRNNRYVKTTLFGKHWCVHKLVYMYHRGYVPEHIDHVNMDSLDNRIENLREVTKSQNMANRKLMANNTSGCKGVSWNKARGKWAVYINVNSTRKSVGAFEDFELAELVAMEARNKYHGEFANHA